MNSGLAAAPGDGKKLLELQKELRFCTCFCFAAQASSLRAGMLCLVAEEGVGREGRMQAAG